MHPIEHLVYFSGILVHWVVASHPIHAMFHVFHAGLSAAPGHTGYDRIGAEKGKSVTIGAYMHYLHHQYFECNYGGDGLPLLDKLMGTYHDGSPEAHEVDEAAAAGAAVGEDGSGDVVTARHDLVSAVG